MRSQMVDLDSKAVQQAALIREAKADESNYLLYLNKRDQELTSDAWTKTESPMWRSRFRPWCHPSRRMDRFA